MHREIEIASGTAIDTVRADGDALLAIGADLTDEQWQAPSGCEGWRVQDVVTHLANLFWLLSDPAKLPGLAGLPTEQAQEMAVQARRGMSGPEALADYGQARGPALVKLAELAALDIEVPLGDLGSYPAALLPTAYSFDHYTHIRADLFGPRGPLTVTPLPSGSRRIEPVLDWIEAALPQQNPAAATASRLEIKVTGIGARSIAFGSGQPSATISGDALPIVRWVTQRGSFEQLGVQAVGDEEALATARLVKVF
jgi:uncharacterized protein (TIGR03083 family)